MKYSVQDLGFILYNNRSVNGVVKNFLDEDIDPHEIIQIEDKFDWCKTIFEFSEKFVEVGRFNKNEFDFLKQRKISESQIKNWSILGLSSIKEREDLRRIGATCHPVLSGFLKDGIEEGGIVFPLIENGVLTNFLIYVRLILKYIVLISLKMLMSISHKTDWVKLNSRKLMLQKK